MPRYAKVQTPLL